jgi:hypothetical protein
MRRWPKDFGGARRVRIIFEEHRGRLWGRGGRATPSLTRGLTRGPTLSSKAVSSTHELRQRPGKRDDRPTRPRRRVRGEPSQTTKDRSEHCAASPPRPLGIRYYKVSRAPFMGRRLGSDGLPILVLIPRFRIWLGLRRGRGVADDAVAEDLLVELGTLGRVGVLPPELTERCIKKESSRFPVLPLRRRIESSGVSV